MLTPSSALTPLQVRSVDASTGEEINKWEWDWVDPNNQQSQFRRLAKSSS